MDMLLEPSAVLAVEEVAHRLATGFVRFLCGLAFVGGHASTVVLADSAALDSSVHWGQRLAKPGLSGFSSNSSLQMAQTLIGKGMSTPWIILNDD